MAQFQCPKCGKILEKGISRCPSCDATFTWTSDPSAPRAPAASQYPNTQPNRPVVSQTYQPKANTINQKSKLITLLLCIFFGFFGAHHFYAGKKSIGILYLCTFGLCGILWIVDIVKILSGAFRDKNGLPLDESDFNNLFNKISRPVSNNTYNPNYSYIPNNTYKTAQTTNQTLDYRSYESSLPEGIIQNLSQNPYYNKYDDTAVDIDTAVYLLYCDFTTAFRWIKDASTPEAFYQNYISAIQILKALMQFNGRYIFNKPTPQEQFIELCTDYNKYSMNFIKRYWNSTLSGAEKLKTDKGKMNRLTAFHDKLINTYGNYLTHDNKALIQHLISNKQHIKTQKIKVECSNYDVSSIEGIRRIPASDKSVLRLLQKAATDHKRNGDLDLAIECLRKSNQISDNIETYVDKLTVNEYTRLISFLRYAKLYDEAEKEEKKVKITHPEFFDMRISNLARIKDCLVKCQEYNTDLVLLNTSRSCPVCGKYDNTVFSISGNTKGFPKLPYEIINNGGFCKEHSVFLTTFFEGINTLPDNNKKYK